MILGVVLAGGRSSRFGSDKAGALFAGHRLADHAAELLRQHVDRVVIAGRDGDIPDRPRPDLGPLGGIAGALDHAASHGFASVLTIACDMPRLPDGLLDTIARQPNGYCTDAPVLGHWDTALGAALIAHLETADDRSVRRWARSIGAIGIPAASPIPNVNTPDDLSAL